MSRAPRRGPGIATLILTCLIAVMILATGVLIWLCIDMVNTTPQVSVHNDPVALPTAPQETETLPPETTQPQPEHVVARATLLSTGDMLMHKPIIDKCLQGDGTYNFAPIFQYAKDYISAADYALANLETTLAGPGLPYRGFPKFNCPDELVTAAKDAGFDMMLTANNHSFDTGWDGYVRTLEVTRAAGLETLGTMATAEEPKYVIKELNGVRIGMICYTYETSNGKNSMPSLNGNIMYGATYDNVNCYRPSDPESMYQELTQYLAEMKAIGVDSTVLYIHWGPNEYETYAPAAFKKIAQRLCDLGLDVIIGGHPHVVEPMDLLTSTVDPEHRTVILYSMGNAVSNQRMGEISIMPTAHTEDGVLFNLVYCKYSDGTAYLESIELIPTWVNLTDKHYILPLDPETESQWQTLYNLDTAGFNKAKNSYARTMAIVEEGLEKCNAWLLQCQQERDAYYLDLLMNPEKYATEPVVETVPVTEAPAEAVPAEQAGTPVETVPVTAAPAA